MKKLLCLISSITLTSSWSTTVISCGLFIQEKEIKEHLKVTDLGEVANNQEITIITRLKELNSELKVDSIKLSNITDSKALVSSNGDGIYKGSIEVIFSLKVDPSLEIDLNQHLKVTDLGGVANNQEITIITRLKELNSELKVDSIKLSNITDSKALVLSNGDGIYKGNVEVIFSLKVEPSLEIDLNQHLKVTDLGEIANNQEITIITRLNELNSELKVNSIKLSNITDSKVLVSSNGDGIYKGNVEVIFKLKEAPIETIDKVLVGYYYEWGGTAQLKPSFEEMANTNYNVIDISFLYSPTAYTMPVFEPWNPADMKAGIKLLQSRGKKVLISMGGATGSEMRFRSDQKDELKETILNVVNEYGFDGLDIDWEGSCLADRESQQVTIDALKEIKDNNPEFIITMAPEMPYLKNYTEASGGSYIPFLKQLDKYYNWINPQFYNGWAFGPFIEEEEKQRLNLSLGSITNDDVTYRAEFYYLMTKYLTTKYSRLNDFYLIDPDRFVMGASTNEPAGRGAATEESIKKSYKLLSEDGIYTKGLMTWAINFDAYEGMIESNGQQVMFKKWSFESWYNETHNKENK
ncbi:glycosyl hydrolase family 18 protein [Spiroplasma endosymbiont of Cantharis nigra]|uniref:glycosyl hydrolase family 18 protein n=1 Tax=Spiroplasma endosymbiont of Cantharis nigra TaxID=3066278 RepID=UPI0030CE1AB4